MDSSRLQVLLNHLQCDLQNQTDDNCIKFQETLSTLPFSVNINNQYLVDDLKHIMVHQYWNERKDLLTLRQEMFRFILDQQQDKNKMIISKADNKPLFQVRYNWNKDLERKIVMERTHVLQKQKWLSVEDQSRDPAKVFLFYETLSCADNGTTAGKLGIHYTLFGGSVLFLGTKKHHDTFLHRINEYGKPLIGSFAMTELAHGSNVQGLQTIATYISETDEIDIYTPNDAAQKYWIGNAAESANWAVVFAQFIVKGVNHGIHAFLVPIRSEKDHSILPNITIKDVGTKIGMNGFDNGRIWFEHVRVPRENLLDRFAKLDSHGVYTSPIKNKNTRFFETLGALLNGRAGTLVTVVQGMKVVMITALTYAQSRRQFGPKNQAEYPVIKYKIHQTTLLPLLGATFALHFAAYFVRREIEKIHEKKSTIDSQELHAFAGALKSRSTSLLLHTNQVAREACGGLGYQAAARFGHVKEAVDAAASFEGVNVVLYQLAAKYLLSTVQDELKKKGFIFTAAKLGFKKIKTYLFETNPITRSSYRLEDLESQEFLMNSFEYREWVLLMKLVDKLQYLMKKKKLSSFDAWSEAQDISVNLGLVYSERIMMREFSKAIEKQEEKEKLKPQSNQVTASFLLKKLRALWGISIIAKDPIFVTYQYVSVERMKRIQDLVSELCTDILPFINICLESFDIPKEILNTPLVGDWIAANSKNVEYE